MLGRFSEPAYALLRIVAALVWAEHGAQKLFGVLGGNTSTPLSLLWWAGVIEFFGGLLIAAGVAVTPVAFIASGEMAVAYFRAHAPQGFWPILNRGELAVLYCFLWLYVATRGAGKWALWR
jgi:putative oxidoreductase